MSSSTDRIERELLLKAPISRVWRALTTAEEFGQWFGVALEGKSFVEGDHMKWQITYPGYEHIRFDVYIGKIQPETHFSYRWHPYAVNPEIDYTQEPPTEVVFTLRETEQGTLLRVVESGFDQVPAYRREEAFRMNSGGWEGQFENIQEYVEKD